MKNDGICFSYTSVNDPGGCGHGIGDIGSEPLAYFVVHLLRLLGGGCFARADRPHRFVRDHYSAPVVHVVCVFERRGACSRPSLLLLVSQAKFIAFFIF